MEVFTVLFSIGLADIQENGLNNLMLPDGMESESDNEDALNLQEEPKDIQKSHPKTPVKVEVKTDIQVRLPDIKTLI